jgi:hypothetical protein
MKLIDGIKLGGKPVIIPDCGRDTLPQFLKEMGLTTGAEVGVYKAAFTEKFCKEDLLIYAIDPWMAYQGAGKTQKEQARQDFLFGHAGRVLAPYKNVKIIRKTSVEAAKDFKDGSLDFVYIDGDHRFPYVAEDIYNWYAKVKKGGIVSGHDYYNVNPGANNVLINVKSVVDAFIEAFYIPNFYIFGQIQPPDKGPKDDRYFSWMFFK